MENKVNGNSKETSKNDEMKNEQLKKLRSEAKEAEKKAILAELELARAVYPADVGSLSDPGQTRDQGELAGKISIGENAGYYAEICAYVALDQAADKIKNDLTADLIPDKKVIIVKDGDFTSRIALWHFLKTKVEITVEHIQNVIEEANKLLKPGISREDLSASLEAISGILGSLATIASYFKPDYELKAMKVNVNERALIASIAGKLKDIDDNMVVILPDLYFSPGGTILKWIEDLKDKRNELLDTKAKVEAKLKEIGDTNPELKKQLEEILKVIETHLKDLDDFLKYMIEKPANSTSPLEMVYVVDCMMKHEDAMILSVFLSSHGGNIETYRHPIAPNFIIFDGGVVVGYILMEKDGKCRKAGFVSEIRSERKRTNKALDDIESKIKKTPSSRDKELSELEKMLENQQKEIDHLKEIAKNKGSGKGEE